MDPTAVVTCWVELTAASQYISGRDSGTLLPSLMLAYSSTTEWGKENKEAGDMGE